MSNQENPSAKQHAKNTGKGAAIGAVSAAVSVFSFKSLTGVILTKIGFTAGGVGASTVAAGVQAGIGNVVAGSLFASLQSAAATGLAVLAPVYLPAITIGSLIGAGYALNRSFKKQQEQKKRREQQQRRRRQKSQQEKRKSSKISLASIFSLFNKGAQQVTKKSQDMMHKYSQYKQKSNKKDDNAKVNKVFQNIGGSLKNVASYFSKFNNKQQKKQ